MAEIHQDNIKKIKELLGDSIVGLKSESEDFKKRVRDIKRKIEEKIKAFETAKVEVKPDSEVKVEEVVATPEVVKEEKLGTSFCFKNCIGLLWNCDMLKIFCKLLTENTIFV